MQNVSAIATVGLSIRHVGWNLPLFFCGTSLWHGHLACFRSQFWHALKISENFVHLVTQSAHKCAEEFEPDKLPFVQRFIGSFGKSVVLYAAGYTSLVMVQLEIFYHLFLQACQLFYENKKKIEFQLTCVLF